MGIRIGQSVEVRQGAGLDSGRQGRVIPRSEVRTDGRGIPLIAGHYCPMRRDEVAIRDDGGEVFTMFRGCLIVRS